MPEISRLRAVRLPRIVPVLTLVSMGCDTPPTEPEAGSTAPLVAASASVNSGSTQRTSLPLGLNYVFECDDGTEYQLFVYGYVDMVTHTSIDGAGILHNSIHWNPHVTAIDATGQTYLGGYSRLNLTINGSDGSLSHTQMIRLIGTGQGPNLHFQLVHQQTVNGNGELTVDFERSRVTCEV